MKGVLLCGGTGTRLNPLTIHTNKHLLPIGKYPMIYYPINTMKECGITDILIITSSDYAGQFVDLLGDGSNMGCNIYYSYQDEALGIADALRRAEIFIGNDDNFLTLLGDNIFNEKLNLDLSLGFSSKLFLTEVKHPEHYGVVQFDDNEIFNIEEKPKYPKSSIIATGAYLYPSRVFPHINELTPSERGELEITHINNMFIGEEGMDYQILKTDWYDCGESLKEYNNTSFKMKDATLKY